MKCKLGLIVYGPIENTDLETKRICYAKSVEKKDTNEEIKELMYNYFEIESCGVKENSKTILSKEHERAFDIMQTTTKFIGDRYECGLLWKTNNVIFPPSYEIAHRRLILLERKFEKDQLFATKYCAKIEELFEKNYAQRLSTHDKISPKIYFLPHFAVVNQ